MTRIDEIQSEVGNQPALLEGEPPGRVGIPLEFHTAWGHEFNADDVHKLTTNAEIEVLHAIPERDDSGRKRTRVLLNVPYGALHVLRDKFRRFGEDSTEYGNTPNPWIANLEQIARAAIPGLWTDEEALPDDSAPHWWEFWLHSRDRNTEVFRFLAERFGIELKREELKLLDRRVLIGSATRPQLESALPLLDCLAELRRARALHLDWTDLSPEEKQDLMVHTAERMVSPAEGSPAVTLLDTGVNGTNPHRQGTGSRMRSILRQYGYGEPDAARARHSARNAVTLFREESLRPFTNNRGLNDCHIHTLPIPQDLLGNPLMGDAVMRVTLSYFVAPSPSANSRLPGSRYRYAGCLLRFDTRNVNESEDAFLARVGSIAADETDEEADSPEPDPEDTGAQTTRRSPNTSRWALGPKLRAKGGSLIHDVWQGPVVDLLTMNQIAVYPKKGWWAFRTFERGSPWHQCNRRAIPYSLIVSIETVADIPLYSEISNLLSIPVQV